MKIFVFLIISIFQLGTFTQQEVVLKGEDPISESHKAFPHLNDHFHSEVLEKGLTQFMVDCLKKNIQYVAGERDKRTKSGESFGIIFDMTPLLAAGIICESRKVGIEVLLSLENGDEELTDAEDRVYKSLPEDEQVKLLKHWKRLSLYGLVQNSSNE